MRDGLVVGCVGTYIAMFSTGQMRYLVALGIDVTNIENGLRLYNKFRYATTDAWPVYLRDSFVLTEWISLSVTEKPTNLGIDREQYRLTGRWQEGEAPCSEPVDYYYVTPNFDNERGQPILPCSRCVVESSFEMNGWGAEVGTFNWDPGVGSLYVENGPIAIPAEYRSTYYPYILWRCEAKTESP